MDRMTEIFFDAFKDEARALILEKILNAADASAIASAFARIAAKVSLDSVREEAQMEPTRQDLSNAVFNLGLSEEINIVTPYSSTGEMMQHIIIKAREIRALQSPARVAEGEERIYTKADMEAACALVLAGFRSKPVIEKMVNRFLLSRPAKCWITSSR